MNAPIKIETGRMTSKGQVLIPKAVREAVGLKPGAPVTISVNEHGEAVVRPATGFETIEQRRARIRTALERVAGTVDFGFATTDEYMDFIRPHRLERL